jgi:hypothetical protein
MTNLAAASAVQYQIPRKGVDHAFYALLPMFGIALLTIVTPLAKHYHFPMAAFFSVLGILSAAAVVGFVVLFRETAREERHYRATVREAFPEETFTNKQLSQLRSSRTLTSERGVYQGHFDKVTGAQSIFFTPAQ